MLSEDFKKNLQLPDSSIKILQAKGSINSEILFLHMENVGGSSSIFSPESYTLFEKIKQAMELGDRTWQIMTLQQNSTIKIQAVKNFIKTLPAEVIIGLGKDFIQLLGTRGQWQELGNKKIIASHSPVDLLQNPELKRDMWNDMKMVMRQLGIQR